MHVPLAMNDVLVRDDMHGAPVISHQQGVLAPLAVTHEPRRFGPDNQQDNRRLDADA